MTPDCRAAGSNSSFTYLGFKFTDAGGGATPASPQPAAPAPAEESSVPSRVHQER